MRHLDVLEEDLARDRGAHGQLVDRLASVMPRIVFRSSRKRRCSSSRARPTSWRHREHVATGALVTTFGPRSTSDRRAARARGKVGTSEPASARSWRRWRRARRGAPARVALAQFVAAVLEMKCVPSATACPAAATDSEPRASSSASRQYVVMSASAPPYFSDSAAPASPAPRCAGRARRELARSSSACAAGATSASTKRATLLRSLLVAREGDHVVVATASAPLPRSPRGFDVDTLADDHDT